MKIPPPENLMQFHSNFFCRQNYSKERGRIAYLLALTLLFSYTEMLLPRGVPFFRLGLANIAIFSAFNLSIPSFFMLTVFKAAASSLMAGTLFSPFVLVSLAQSVSSGILMYGIFHLNSLFKKKLLSLYGISVLGSAASAAAQIFLSSLYLGKGAFSLLGPMLIFNAASGILTAFLAQIVQIPENTPVLKNIMNENRRNDTSFLDGAKIILVLVLSASVFFIDSIPVLAGFLALSFLLQILSGRKTMLFPHICLWIFVIISTLLVPNGKILLQLGKFSVTEGALLGGISKALRLSAASAFSQCAAGLNVSRDTLLGATLDYYNALLKILKTSDGKIFARLKKTLTASEL